MKTKEAPALLKGEAKFIADMALPEMLHVAILRSAEGHALIKSIDTSACESMPGVVRVFTWKDTQQIMPLPVVWVPPGVESHFPPHPSGIVPGSQVVLAKEKVRFVGEQIAAVVAQTRQQAYDALAGIKVEYEPLPVVLEAEDAMKEGAPQLHDAAPHNLLAHSSFGDKAAAEKAIAEAEVVVKQRLHNQRMIHSPIEVRGAVALYESKGDNYTLWTNTQIPSPHRLLISLYVLGIPYNKLHVVAPAMGESMGCKGNVYAESPLLLCIAKALGRPVKWVDTRAGYSTDTAQSRDQTQYATLAGTKDGKIQALMCTAFSNIGAYPVINAPGQPLPLIGRSITGAYMIDHPFYEVNIVYTNKTPGAPMRGSGRAEAIFLIERMVDIFARKIGMDPAEVRRKNMVPPDKFPFDNKLGWIYDSGNYEAALNKALQNAGYDTMAQRKAEARKRGKRLGVGIGSYVAVAGVGRSRKMGDEGLVSGTWASAYMSVAPSGEVCITTGAQPHGQSQETTFAQIAAQELGIPTEMIRVRHSDTEGALYYSQASYGSRSLSVEGAAVQKAARHIVDKIRNFAAFLFKAPLEAIVYEKGRVYLSMAPDKATMTLQQVAFVLWLGWDLPEGMDPGLETIAYFDPPNFNFPFGTHVAVVEVDEETGKTDIVKYVAVDDFGTVVNPLVVDGQTHGNIALGIGQALYEEAIYDDRGRVLTDGFSTYAIPKASFLPTFELERTVTPSPSNPLGAKGAGDVSNPPVAPAIINAVCDALSDLGVDHVEMPATPEKLWRILSKAQSGKGK
jgi:aerobic carbon-monoxide dehydrogenase large subunit